jgi:SAM-dependent methyltransferase
MNKRTTAKSRRAPSPPARHSRPPAPSARQAAQRQAAPSAYPSGFVFGRGEANPAALSLSGLKIARALAALRPVRGKVLELGCGGGQYLRALRRHRPDLEVYGIDLDPICVAEALYVPQALCCRADAAALPFPPGAFQAVIGFDILEHVARPERVLAEAARVLARNGLLHLYVPCEGNPGSVYQRRGHALKARWGGHVQQFASGDLMRLIREAGLAVDHVRYADYWLTQQLDYLFFSRLSKSKHPERLWAGQALAPGGGLPGAWLRLARRTLSAACWLESTLRRSARGAGGVHITAVKI